MADFRLGDGHRDLRRFVNQLIRFDRDRDGRFFERLSPGEKRRLTVQYTRLEHREKHIALNWLRADGHGRLANYLQRNFGPRF